MNFTITITGESTELTPALVALQNAVKGQQVISGTVSATIAAPATFTAQNAPYQTEQPAAPVQPPAVQLQPTAAPTAPAYPAPTAVPTTAYPPQQPQAPVAVPPTVPTTPSTYTMEQLAVAATQLMDAGRQPELMQLLQHFGVQSLTALPKERYGEFATALRQLGAKI
jgi:hypothetical protein